MQIKLNQATIRPFKKTDYRSLALHANNRNIWRNLRDTFPFPYLEANAIEWLEMATVEPYSSFAIEVDGEAVGAIGYHFQAGIYRKSIELGYWLGEVYWGRGIMTETVRAMVGYSFENYPVNRLFAHAIAWNVGSQKVLQKAGFQYEGTLRQSAFKDGIYADELIYSMLKEEWERY